MNRLVHTLSGAQRAMQISEVQVFVFVEGGLDRPFIEKILRQFVALPLKYRIVAIKEIGGTGGKPALLKHFRNLRRKGALTGEAWGKRFVNLFFVDKDADDALNRKYRSQHVFYTPVYDVEGTLFHYGNVLNAVSDACFITLEQAANIIGNWKEWIATVARNWVDWITLCLISQKNRINGGCTFDRPSTINPDLLGAPDQDILSQKKIELMTRLEMSEPVFCCHYNGWRNKVIKSIDSGEPLKFFKGKWLKQLLQKQAETHQRIPDENLNGVGDRVTISLLGQVGVARECPCVQHYAVFFRNALDMITR